MAQERRNHCHLKGNMRNTSYSMYEWQQKHFNKIYNCVDYIMSQVCFKKLVFNNLFHSKYRTNNGALYFRLWYFYHPIFLSACMPLYHPVYVIWCQESAQDRCSVVAPSCLRISPTPWKPVISYKQRRVMFWGWGGE